tara:strand:+ start:4707 stop:5447 length:741 start_codon:yes stop_codon:yes gene_type:complete
MKTLNHKNNLLIIAPHADDEIFLIEFIKEKKKRGFNIDLLIIDCNKKRLVEAKKSAKILGINFLENSGALNLKDGHFHDKFAEIKKYLLSIIIDYNYVLSPMIEGGHQDHDTISSILILLFEEINLKKHILLYPCYRSLLNFRWIYRCGQNKNQFLDKQISYKVPKKFYPTFINLIFKAYISQLSSWIFLFPALFISRINKSAYILINASNIKFKEVEKMLPIHCLYQIRGRFYKNSWLKIIRSFY